MAESAEMVVCPSCGRPVTGGEAEDLDAADVALAQLTADLREAFGSGAYDALRPEDAANPLFAGRGGMGVAAISEGGGIGSRLGDFELLDELGRGGMGIVYRARQVSLDREVALKVLPSSARRNRAAVARFRRESQAAARLHHTNIVPIYAQGEQDGKFYYAMELIEGESLDSAMRCDSSVASLTPRPVTPPTGWERRSGGGRTAGVGAETPRLTVTSLRRARQDYRRIARLLSEVADGLDHAHRCDVIHRDIKPHNLLLGQDHRLHITDFGLAHLRDEPHLTQSGEMMGTPSYMSPEQVEGRQEGIDQRTDIYSLGVTLYELLTLQRPFEGPTREQVIHRICTAEAQRPRRLDGRIPLDLETICLRAMEKEPARRYPTAAALAEDLLRFAEDRPILTRRTGPIAKALKWSRRHKAASTAIVAVALAVVAATTLAASVIASRRSEAARLIDNAYAQLVYQNYHDAERVAGDLTRAERLGGDPPRLELVRTLADMSASDTRQPVARLERLCALDPQNVEPLYLLAWAYWRDGQYDSSRECFQRAEGMGGARTAAECFFRGLASQFDHPQRAIESYDQARQVRAQQKEFFPQATLHLARARNQLMYRTRRIDTFDEAESALLELIKYQVYGEYPCYLLSIAHRLAAEIYAGSEGTRPENADYHYAEALKWARRGQELAKPGSDASLTAEAECHESMGNFPEALVARTAAIERAAKPGDQWEGYHYRWRLYYWTNQLDAALADLRTLHERFDPGSMFYSHVYPMLVLAEAGRMDEALALARGLAESAEGTPAGGAIAVLWSATSLRLVGRPEEAGHLLDVRADTVDSSVGLTAPQSADWMAALYGYAAGRTPFEALLEQAGQVADPPRLAGEAYFHAASIKLAAGDRAGALRDFQEAYRSFDEEKRYTFHAQILRKKLTDDPEWPPWIHSAAPEASGNSRAD